MSLFRLPRGKFPLTFLAVPAGKDCRVECPCQTFDGFIGIRGKICGFFLLVQTHTPLIVPLRQRRAGKSGFHFISGARARNLSAMHLLSVDSLMAYRCLPLCGLFRFFNGFRKNLLHTGFKLVQIVSWPLHGIAENFLFFRVRQIKDRILEYLKHKPSITNRKAQELCGFSKNQTY